MKLELFTQKTNEVWKEVSAGALADARQFELELDNYKRILNFFQVGEYYYIIFNINAVKFEFVSPAIAKVLGYSAHEFSVTTLLDCIHPDDRPWFFAFESKTAEFFAALPVEKLMQYKVRSDFRVRHKSGHYVRILHQVVVIQHAENGTLLRTLAIHTDITHLKKDGQPVLSYIGLDEEPSYLDIDVGRQLAKSQDTLTPREKEILMLLIEGKLSKQIGDILGISKKTVDNHRKNMLSRTNLNTTAELVGKAIRQGWI